MIDDKKIEEAAKQHAEETFISGYWQACYMEGFMSCAKWMRKKVIVEYTYKGGIHYRSIKIPDDIQWVRGFSNEKRLRRWMYVDDLFPKEGDE